MKKDFLHFVNENADYRLVFLHGWGADAEDLLPLGQELNELLDKKLELVFLRGFEDHPDGLGRQWYPLFPHDWSLVPAANVLLQKRLKAIESMEIGLTKTVILGFSQGGAMALSAACNLPVLGIIACSGYPHPGFELVSSNCAPVFLTHGQYDEVVPKKASEKILDNLNQKKVQADLFIFQGQ